MSRFSDPFRLRVLEDQIRISVRVTERKVDEYTFSISEIRGITLSFPPGPEWVEAGSLKVRIRDGKAMIGFQVSAYKWEIYSMVPGNLVRFLAQLRAAVGEG